MSHTLPTDLTLDRLDELLHQQGRWLAAQQPTRAVADMASIKPMYEHCYQTAQAQLQRALTAAWPQIPVLAAEFGTRSQARPAHAIYWVCDPLDGALHYLSGLPWWTVTLCLMVNGQPALSLVHYPAGSCTYRAQAGQGAACNGSPLRTSDRQQLELAVLATSFPNYPQRDPAEISDFLSRLGRTVPRIFGQRWLGPASLLLAKVAAGQLDGYWETGYSRYDWLAGVLLVQEAGGVVSALDKPGFDWGSHGILAANPSVHAAVQPVLALVQEVQA